MSPVNVFQRHHTSSIWSPCGDVLVREAKTSDILRHAKRCGRQTSSPTKIAVCKHIGNFFYPDGALGRFVFDSEAGLFSWVSACIGKPDLVVDQESEYVSAKEADALLSRLPLDVDGPVAGRVATSLFRHMKMSSLQTMQVSFLLAEASLMTHRGWRREVFDQHMVLARQ